MRYARMVSMRIQANAKDVPLLVRVVLQSAYALFVLLVIS